MLKNVLAVFSWDSRGYPEDASTYNRDTCSILFIAALFIIARSWKKNQMPLNRGMDTENVVHLHNGVVLSY